VCVCACVRACAVRHARELRSGQSQKRALYDSVMSPDLPRISFLRVLPFEAPMSLALRITEQKRLPTDSHRALSGNRPATSKLMPWNAAHDNYRYRTAWRIDKELTARRGWAQLQTINAKHLQLDTFIQAELIICKRTERRIADANHSQVSLSSTASSTVAFRPSSPHTPPPPHFPFRQYRGSATAPVFPHAFLLLLLMLLPQAMSLLFRRQSVQRLHSSIDTSLWRSGDPEIRPCTVLSRSGSWFL
jgi:hypothetical protein